MQILLKLIIAERRNPLLMRKKSHSFFLIKAIKPEGFERKKNQGNHLDPRAAQELHKGKICSCIT